MSHLAIVGAGVSGLGAAWALRNASLEVTVFEKSRGVAGRAATHGRHGTRYDHGANYIQISSDQVRHVIHEQLPTDDLVEIERDIWTFDASETVREGDPESNATPKWTYRQGISTLGKLLVQEASAEVRRETRIRRLHWQRKGWTLTDSSQTTYGPFTSVLLTPPAPQTVDLLKASQMPPERRAPLIKGLRAAEYQSQFTCVLAFGKRIARPGPFFALLNTDRAHDIAWLSFEEDKPGHVPAGQSVLVVQMAPSWTEAHFEAAQDELVNRVQPKVASLLDIAPS